MITTSPYITGLFQWVKQYAELMIWSTALTLLFLIHPESSGSSLCVFRYIGFASCPGCGLGHSIHYAMHFEFLQSIHAHLFGIPAVLIILHRIIQLSISKKIVTHEA